MSVRRFAAPATGEADATFVARSRLELFPSIAAQTDVGLRSVIGREVAELRWRRWARGER